MAFAREISENYHSVAATVLGKNEVSGSNPDMGSRNSPAKFTQRVATRGPSHGEISRLR